MDGPTKIRIFPTGMRLHECSHHERAQHLAGCRLRAQSRGLDDRGSEQVAVGFVDLADAQADAYLDGVRVHAIRFVEALLQRDGGVHRADRAVERGHHTVAERLDL